MKRVETGPREGGETKGMASWTCKDTGQSGEEKETAEAQLLDLMEQWEAAQS